MSIQVRVTAEPFDPYLVLSAAAAFPGHAGCGAGASFVGTVRDADSGDPLDALVLEHYPGMAEREIEAVCREAQTRRGLAHIEVWHRVGQLRPGDPIVVVGVWSSHRAEAFDACREIVTYLKERAPFWKREQHRSGERWVAENTNDFGVSFR
jgi:molybdopterin synthase catalytic subunit